MTDEELIARRIGTSLRGKWTLTRVLGVGGMAAVYVGEHKIGREDAIKILHPEVARSANVRARFEQEAHAANRLKHPGVVEIRDVDTSEDGAPFMVMELLSGESLASRVKRVGTIEPADVMRYADELLDVLVAAHAQGIIHRDIKPDNLFILGDGRLKVLDFGIARMKEGAPQTMHTRAGSTLGTVAYMPPEQTMGSNIDERADLFAVGATMFRLLANRHIHDANSEMDLLVKMASDPAPPLASVAPHVRREIAIVVDRALAFSRAQRYPDAKTMQADVRAVRAGGAPPYAEARLSSDGPPAGPSQCGSSASLEFALSGTSERPTVQEGKVASALPASTSTSAPASISYGSSPTLPVVSSPMSSPMSSPSPSPMSSPMSSPSPSPMSSPMSSPASSPPSPLSSGSASAVMPLLAGRAERAKADSASDRKRLYMIGGAALAVLVLLIAWLSLRGGSSSDDAPDADAESAGSSSSDTGGSKSTRKGKGPVKWRKPKGSTE